MNDNMKEKNMERTKHSVTILIVDDTPENLDVLSGILSNYKRYFAINGIQAIERANTVVPDLILLDIMMPDMDGYEVCRQLKENEKTRHIPVIFITAKTEEKDEIIGFEMGGVDYISKPICPAKIKARVKTHLTLKQAMEKLKEQNKILIEHQNLLEEVERITRHDLKSPLNAIINHPELIRMYGPLNDKQLESLQLIEENGYRLLTMINHSLDLYKMETGKYTYTPFSIDIVPILNKIIYKDFNFLIENRCINVHMMMNEKPVAQNSNFFLQGNDMLCYSMFSNIIKNALEASKYGDDIYITLKAHTMAEIQIQNSGVVPKEIQDSFFEKYSTYGKGSGTGLGTYSARLMAKTQHGTIAMKTSETIGTIITIQLPLE